MAPTEQMKPMKQLSLAEMDFLPKAAKQTRETKSLSKMETEVPWSRLEVLIEPHSPKNGSDWPPTPLDTDIADLLCVTVAWLLRDDEEALHDVPLLHRFAWRDAFEDVMPEESTILHFKHLLKKHDLEAVICAKVNALLSEKGLSIKRGSVVDATLATRQIRRRTKTRNTPRK